MAFTNGVSYSGRRNSSQWRAIPEVRFLFLPPAYLPPISAGEVCGPQAETEVIPMPLTLALRARSGCCHVRLAVGQSCSLHNTVRPDRSGVPRLQLESCLGLPPGGSLAGPIAGVAHCYALDHSPRIISNLHKSMPQAGSLFGWRHDLDQRNGLCSQRDGPVAQRAGLHPKLADGRASARKQDFLTEIGRQATLPRPLNSISESPSPSTRRTQCSFMHCGRDFAL
jgi:hypothetical protein